MLVIVIFFTLMPNTLIFVVLVTTILAFRLFDQEEKTWSWWDYRAAAFRRNLGLRIDLVLASKVLAEVCTASYIDKEPRRQERPSDHAPAVAEFESAL